jgi:hypothetical protein
MIPSCMRNAKIDTSSADKDDFEQRHEQNDKLDTNESIYKLGDKKYAGGYDHAGWSHVGVIFDTI